MAFNSATFAMIFIFYPAKNSPASVPENWQGIILICQYYEMPFGIPSLRYILLFLLLAG